MVADAALRGAARDVVRDAIAGERSHVAVVERGRDRDLDCLLALLQDVDEALVDPERLGDLVELLPREREGILEQMRLGGRSHRARIYLIVNRTCALLGSACFGSVGQAASRSS